LCSCTSSEKRLSRSEEVPPERDRRAVMVSSRRAIRALALSS
jgi:hypothetical protein